ncbi:2,4-dienoyl-CoA reductase-like NADH-dependent reductase (Old Yellow Enzyme family)/thioredoxin reductase [Paenibacillus forsythiae]|uniref:2,4-dienoyl-CoA reductase-like NADH-dependent reductase (Old Yellow Enzyme family)/thioredoxin reductase n=3 Tax=Paenibacillus forsythiae TaxID=365616 RepID=A0ABU3H4X7_9BACL|nr:FAD-dependent oxidoreductase [Paenibacillus forsythiae]MDT3425872.1 2,4-dienoyl-CoA reductase-like NADH-dependent reductase (Old Yellow Enzyme family)/thioredoxin reductase [Paenibacillus forsythiae]
MFTRIFEPGKIGNLEIKNRLIVPPMLTEYAAEDGRLTERYIRYYEEKAKGGWGLIIAEDNAVEPRGAGFKNIAGLWSDELMQEHKELVERVHKTGAKIAVQVYHAGREASSEIMGMRPVAPSPIQDPTQSETPVEMTTDEVKEMVEKFAQAIRRCQEAGYDAIELHGAHGYLINQFVSPFSNKRTDAYGGNLMNRLRFPLEIIARAKELVGEEFPIIYRISADEMVEGGLTIEDTKVISQVLEHSGVAAIHASAGVYKTGAIVSAPTSIRTAVFSDYAKEIRKVVNIPVFAVNKIIYPHVAESILKEGKADFVAMGRASTADPQFPNKVKEGRLDEIIFCIGCRQGCQWRIAQQNPVSCLVNPLTGKEGEYELKEAEVKKQVMVIGGGPVGMEAAIIAAKRGHDVTLYDKSDRLGGQWLLAAIPPGKELLNTFTVWQKGELDRSGVQVVLNTEVTKELVEQVNPDEIILASGAAPIIPGIPGADKAHVYTANDVLLGKVDLAGQVVVIGGGLVGAETAEHIAVHNRKTSIVEMRPEIAADMEPASKEFLLKSLKHNEVAVHVNSKVLEITDTHVIIETEEGQQALPAALVVLAIGSKSNNALVSELGDKHSVKVIGDAAVVGKALEGINLAYKTALAI